eukprot:TRINITY_DN41811_c0_g1_i1.p1 TRINITY_DN41811_c0_g1~~TRINITY_DN41811_c0_g1_i1.p1  ORF type:complete len:975 (-),score=211.27 TRINITY_DN41811_c0_g1_i1:563-3487(-)
MAYASGATRNSWGRGGGRGKGKGRGSLLLPQATDEGRQKSKSPGRHYFQQDSDADTGPKCKPVVDEEARKQELKTRKKLREVEALEERQRAGETLEQLQLQKVAKKGELEQELAQLLASSAPTEAELSDEKLKALLEEEQRLLEEDRELLEERADVESTSKAKGAKGRGKAKSSTAPSLPVPAVRRTGNASPRGSPRPAVGASSLGLAWGKASPTKPGASSAEQSSTSAVKLPRRGWAPGLPNAVDDLQDPSVVFTCCDTDESGGLDVHETKFALSAFGIHMTVAEIERLVGDEPLGHHAFASLVRRLQSTAPESSRGPRAIPYSRRGISLGQMQAMHETFVASGWLQERCDEFNTENKEKIAAGKTFAMGINLYALDKFVIRPVTDTEPAEREKVPDRMRVLANLPVPTHKCSYSELTNPNGVMIDYFVSHWWGHHFAETMSALHGWAAKAHKAIGKPKPTEVAWWLCFLALNQHRAGEEVGATPEAGPFNAALMQAKGAVMILDEAVKPFERIWCLYEVSRLTALQKEFHLINSTGLVGGCLDSGCPLTRRKESYESARQIDAALEKVSAFKAMASNEDDKYAIWHRIADPRLRNRPLHILKCAQAFGPDAFKQFDATVTGLLAGPLFQASLDDEDGSSALRYIGLGAAFGPEDLDKLEKLCGKAIELEASVRRGATRVNWKLIHCAAFFNHIEAVGSLVQRGADVNVKTRFGFTSLHLAASIGNADTVDKLVELQANLEDKNKEERTALHAASHMGHVETVKRLLRHGADIQSRDNIGDSPIHGAAKAGHADVVTRLLEEGADPEEDSADGNSPLSYAAKDDLVNVAEVLLEHGEKLGRCSHQMISRKLKHGKSAMDLARRCGRSEVATLFRARTSGSLQSPASTSASPTAKPLDEEEISIHPLMSMPADWRPTFPEDLKQLESRHNIQVEHACPPDDDLDILVVRGDTASIAAAKPELMQILHYYGVFIK